jgi:hydroxymethylglutaryl-CoA lyase
MLPQPITAADKVELIENLRAAGLPRIEVTSFVSPKWVPQMADADEVLHRLSTNKNSKLMVVALNEKGYQRAVQANVDWICYVIAATETFNRKNANTTLADALKTFERAADSAHQNGIKIRGSISVTWICPYEGKVTKEKVLEITEQLLSAGADEIAYNDTVGKTNPKDVQELCAMARERWPDVAFAAHFHDTSFTALANIYAALTAGWTIFDSSIAGLGGCPFSPGASGNVATEKVVWMANQMGLKTNIDEMKLKNCVDIARRLANGNPTAI